LPRFGKKVRELSMRWVWIGLWLGLETGSAWAQMAPAHRPDPNPASISGDLSARPQATPASLAAEETRLRHELGQQPDSPEILYKLGLVLRLENQPKESLAIYTRAARFRKPDADQLRSVALDYVLLNDYEDAVHWLEIAAQTDPDNPDVLYSLGRCRYTQGHYAEAEDLYLRVLRIAPSSIKTEENLGLAYDADNQTEKAEAALRLAADWARRQTSDEWPFLNLGTFLLAHDKAADAVPFLQQAVRIAPKSAICHEKFGRALEESGREQEGVGELETAVVLDPKNPNMHFELGHAYRKVGAEDKARAEFTASRELRRERDQE
jgi:tetratricopeptide (TPR) repeat protein